MNPTNARPTNLSALANESWKMRWNDDSNEPVMTPACGLGIALGHARTFDGARLAPVRVRVVEGWIDSCLSGVRADGPFRLAHARRL